MKTVLIDCRFAALHAGLGRYSRELVTHLLRRPSAVRYILLVRDRTEAWIPAGAETIVADIPHYSLREQTVLPGIIRRAKADLFFSPHFNVPVFCTVPFVVTVHDLILHRYPNQASAIKRMAYRAIIGHAVRSSKAIVSVSDFTASEIAREYGSAATAKSVVIREGVSDRYYPVAVKARTRPYFLYVGNAKQHKNVQMLLDAFHRADLRDIDLLLVTGGKEAQSLSLPPNAYLLREVSDTDLPAIYSGARALVTASLYEGYCLPVAEALACSCPVIAANRTAIPETAAGHAMLIEPTVDAFAAAFKHPPTDRSRFVAGTWEKAAAETEALLLKILS
jgi:glycosyltransferase involved in cell wall biosynthesis